MVVTHSGLVSIVIPVYNRPALLIEAIESALAQTYRPIEVIVVDDGSTDDTAQAAQDQARTHPGVVRYMRVTHGGVARAMNEGLRFASGEFIQILDSDDLLLPDKLALQVGGLRAHPECGISYGYSREYQIGRAWSGLPARRTGETFEFLFPAILADKIWPAPSPLFRRSVLDAVGPFCDVSVHTEWELECRAAALGVRLHHCREFVCDTRGAHHIEGRRKAAIATGQLDDYARVLSLIWSQAQQVDLPSASLDRFARRLFAAARRCAAAGMEPSSRRCLDHARDAARTGVTRRKIAVYSALAARIGWQRLGAVTVAIERSRAVAVARTVRRWSRGVLALWSYRAHVARQTIAGQSIARWPMLLKQRWAERHSARPLIFPTRS
jgi:glycosyltransferase involved in cell wall biosynthesis